MYKLLGGLKDYFKVQEVQTDNAVFRLHNVFTTVLLLACSLTITATQYVGNPISCIVSGVPTHVINTFCWISSTFTMPDAFRRQVSKIKNTFGFYIKRRKDNFQQLQKTLRHVDGSRITLNTVSYHNRCLLLILNEFCSAVQFSLALNFCFEN